MENKKIKIVLIHNLPIDYYPPAVNLIHTWNDFKDKIKLSILTTKGSIGSKILKTDYPTKYVFEEKRKCSSLITVIKQVWFVIYTFFFLIKNNPDVILYYETISAPAAYLYHKFFKRKVQIFIHYHEYMTPSDYNRPGFKLWKLYRYIESKWLFNHCSWISHTNQKRMGFFLTDFPNVDIQKCHELPNYPPQKWNIPKLNSDYHHPIRCVYVGSLSLIDLHLDEFVKWVNSQNGKIIVDFFSFNFHSEIIDYFNKNSSPWINLKKSGIPYYSIPKLLSNYDIGLILYKTESINVTYCEPNKLFEYLACGLDVWAPINMKMIVDLSMQAKYRDRILIFNPNTGEWPRLEEKKSSGKNICLYNAEKTYSDLLYSILNVR